MLTINSGIGDILIAKMICKENDIRESIQYNKELVKQYREDSKPYYNFLDQLTYTLFSKDNVENNIKINQDIVNLTYTIKNRKVEELHLLQ